MCVCIFLFSLINVGSFRRNFGTDWIDCDVRLVVYRRRRRNTIAAAAAVVVVAAADAAAGVVVVTIIIHHIPSRATATAGLVQRYSAPNMDTWRSSLDVRSRQHRGIPPVNIRMVDA